MSTISVTNINDGDAVTAASINNQVNTIVNDYNGNITAANLAANAVTDAKITANNLLTTKFSNPYKFSVYRNTAYTTAAGAFTAVPYDTKTFDTSSSVDIVTNKGRFTAPIAGFYYFSATLNLTVVPGANYALSLYKNGAEVRRGTQSLSGVFGAYVGGLVQLAANDYIEAYYFTTNATAASTGVVTGFDGFLVSSI